MKIAAAYIRVSTDDQIEFSPASQISRIREYAKRNDYILPDEFIFMDEGISGRKAEKRPAFMKMIGLAKSKPKPFDTILLWKFSRFARNREDSIVYKSMLRKQCGIDVISVSENLGDDKMSILIEALIEAMDEFYSINLSEEVKRGMTEKAHRGGVLSLPAFGYKVQDGKYIPIPEEADIIKQVFELYANTDAGLKTIAVHLNNMGVKTHRGGKIENRTIEYWLNNPVYIGKTRWTPTGAMDRKYHNPDSIIADGQHDAIVDIEVWDKVQDRLKRTKELYPKFQQRKDLSSWVVSVVRCGECGGPMCNRAGYLYCVAASKGTCKGSGSIKTSQMEKNIIANLKEISAGTKTVYVPVKTEHTKNNNDFINSQIKKSELKFDRIKDAYANGIDTLEEYKANKEKITAEIENLKSQLVHSPDKEEMKPLDITGINRAIEMLESDTLTNTEKRETVRQFITKVVKTNKKDFDFFYCP